MSVTFRGPPAGFILSGLAVMITAPLWARAAFAIGRALAPAVLRRPLASLVPEDSFYRGLRNSYLFVGAVLTIIGALRLLAS